MRLSDCTPEETVLLVAIVALSTQLRGDFSLYAEALGELRRTPKKRGGFGQPGRTREHRRGGFSQSRTIRARERYGR